MYCEKLENLYLLLEQVCITKNWKIYIFIWTKYVLRKTGKFASSVGLSMYYEKLENLYLQLG